MILRIGTVLKVYPESGKVQVTFLDTNSSSLPLPMLTFGREYFMPKIGDIVITLHFETGGSKGVCLGTYYNVNNMPVVNSGYRKCLDENASISCLDNIITIDASSIILKCDYTTITLENLIKRIEQLEARVSSLSAL